MSRWLAGALVAAAAFIVVTGLLDDHSRKE